MQRLLDTINKKFSLQTDIDPAKPKNKKNENEEKNKVPGRDSQYRKLKTFIDKTAKSGKGDSLYICGPPGTGKSLTLTTLSKNLSTKKYKPIYINCMQFNQPIKIYIEIYRKLENLVSTKKGVNESLDLIESKYFYDFDNKEEEGMEKHSDKNENEKKTMWVKYREYEIDILIEKFSNILYRIFEWPTKDSSKLILFGIANDLGLVQKSLPRFAKIGMEIEVLHFKPYTEEEILKIFHHRIDLVFKEYKLKEEDQKEQLFEPETLEMISKQLSVNGCDIRKAFDVIRRLVTLKFEKYIENADSNDSLDEDPDEVIEFKSPGEYFFSMDLVQDVLAEFFECKIVSNMKSLPLQAQIILFSSFLPVLNYETLYKSYKSQCSIINFPLMEKADFGLSIDSIISNGLMKIESGKKIALLFSKEQLISAFKSSIIFDPLLEELNNL
ncbi:hypothetical protein DDB_G0275983 [Dictyostelium discoideum AX4]|uniref:Uncharacterized protein n=1 Tax=Dictyostelium discoideum TaxID=44689 RepID=Q552L8_DICDI|nr:hypothetical protein DDB_G0275983 [Dictyostelium discoideum AX4]EAL69448.1 hypothetical protein DDB_G0275983 [Dictyostelium discoideum AX4]|eukprot:XP_643364.1 hypothetical protein DDB_G0275983 [Dictyostelium discoideum AX4]